MGDAKTMALVRLRDMMQAITYCSDSKQRPLICTPCGGNYGKIEAWVIMVEGSPARGSLYVEQSYRKVFLIDREKSRRLGEAQTEIVFDFQRFWLSQYHAPIKDATTVRISATPW